jgi:hypothetical protein
MISASLLVRAALCLAFSLLVAVPSASAWVAVLDDGAGGRPAILRLQSGIKKGDLAALETALALVDRDSATKVNGVPLIKLELDSPGGDVVEAVAIGQLIYQNYIMTTVRPGRECVSACVFILMAGAVHYPADGASIGVHKPLLVSWSHMSAAQAHAKYDALMDYLRQYFADLGIADRTYEIMMRTASGDMRYFSPSELDQLRLRGEDPAWKELFTARATAAALSTQAPALGLPPPRPLPKIDESWRDIIFMPGADDPKIEIKPTTAPPSGPRYVWALAEDGQSPFVWMHHDIIGFLLRLAAALGTLFEPIWPLLALLALEILRASPWPGSLWDRSRAPDQWRLTPFR